MEISHLMALITSRLNAPEPMIRLVGEVFQIIFWEVLRIIFWGGVADNLVQMNHLSKDKAWLDANHLLPNGSALKSLNRIPMIESKISGAVLFNNKNNNNNNNINDSTLVRET